MGDNGHAVAGGAVGFEGAPDVEGERSASGELVASSYVRYNAAILGFRNYWYPAMSWRSLRSKPVAIQLLGEKIVLVRDRGRVYALRDRCAHRGVPLSYGRSEFPGTLTCAYHGWTYDLRTGRLIAALTDGPDSPICGKVTVSVQTYPAAERAGLIWVFVGDGEPPPVESDIPGELLHQDAVILGRITLQRGNWRLAAEAGIDEGHPRYLHRRSLWSLLLDEHPAWTRFRLTESEDGIWLGRRIEDKHYFGIYPGLGRWPAKKPYFWQRRGRRPRDISIRLPGILRTTWRGWFNFNFWVPVDRDHYLDLFLALKHDRGLAAFLFGVRYWLLLRWFYHGQFHGQDLSMIRSMQVPPERLYRPDRSITSWRQFCEERARRV